MRSIAQIDARLEERAVFQQLSQQTNAQKRFEISNKNKITKMYNCKAFLWVTFYCLADWVMFAT